jgi:hypothetical protein
MKYESKVVRYTLSVLTATAALSGQAGAIAAVRKYIKNKAGRRRVATRCTPFSILLFTLSFAQGRAMAAELAGNVQGAGLPIAGATATLYAAGTSAPTQLAQGKTNDNGAFTLTYADAPVDSVLYVIAKGGRPKAATGKGASEGIALLAVLGGTPLVEYHPRHHGPFSRKFHPLRFLGMHH